MKPEMNTSQYELVHGKKPRGHGSWAFMFDKKTYDDINEVWWTGSMVYSEAKKIALVEAKRRNASIVYVQP
ncbi:MAG: hypothetical protein HY376_00580 [Candidatus Blackburnbacteria bacterium]|nr:hypothetical protein [Candidatus Blackburnbacteria bacterium]